MNVATTTHLLFLSLLASAVSAFLPSSTNGPRQPFHVNNVNVRRWSSTTMKVAAETTNNNNDVYEIDAMGRMYLVTTASTTASTTATTDSSSQSTKEKDQAMAYQTEAVLKEAVAMTVEEVPTMRTVADLDKPQEEKVMDEVMITEMKDNNDNTPTVAATTTATEEPSDTMTNDDSPITTLADVVAVVSDVLQTHPLVETKEEEALALEEEEEEEAETIEEDEAETIEEELVVTAEAEAATIEEEVTVEAEAATVEEAELETVEEEVTIEAAELETVEAAEQATVEEELATIKEELETIKEEVAIEEAELKTIEEEVTIEAAEPATTIEEEPLVGMEVAEAVATEEEPDTTIEEENNSAELATTVEELQQELVSQRKLLQKRIDYFQNSLQEWQQESQAELAQANDQAKEDQLVWAQKVTTLQDQMEEMTATLELEQARSADLERDQKESTVAYAKLEKDLEQKVSKMAKKRETEQEKRTATLVDQVQREAEGRVQATLDKAITDVIEARKYGADQLRQRDDELAKQKSSLKVTRKAMRKMVDDAQELEEDRHSLRKLARQSWKIVKERVKERASEVFNKRGGRKDNLFSR